MASVLNGNLQPHTKFLFTEFNSVQASIGWMTLYNLTRLSYCMCVSKRLTALQPSSEFVMWVFMHLIWAQSVATVKENAWQGSCVKSEGIMQQSYRTVTVSEATLSYFQWLRLYELELPLHFKWISTQIWAGQGCLVSTWNVSLSRIYFTLEDCGSSVAFTLTSGCCCCCF